MMQYYFAQCSTHTHVDRLVFKVYSLFLLFSASHLLINALTSNLHLPHPHFPLFIFNNHFSHSHIPPHLFCLLVVLSFHLASLHGRLL